MPVRRCPTCNRPFPPRGPCPRCALAAKPAQTAVAIEEPESPAANPVVVSVTVEEIPRSAVTPQQSIAQAEATVRTLFEAVASIEENKKVQQIVRDTLSPPGPVKRGRGRPRTPGKEYATEAERKKVERAAARTKLVLALDEFNLTVDSEVAPELQIKYGTTAKTYGQLLKNDSKALKKIIKLLQQEGVRRSTTTGGVLTGAPRGKGKLVTGGYDSTKIDADLGSQYEHQAMLSRPDDKLDGPSLPDSALSTLSLLSNVVVLADGSHSTTDRKRSPPTDGCYEQFEKAKTRETDFTFMSKARWPQSWFTEKHKPEYSEVADECMRQAINAFSHTEAREPDFEPEVGAAEITARYCVLCEEKLGGDISAMDHLLGTHLSSVRKFFRQAGVRFNRKYFGISDTD